MVRAPRTALPHLCRFRSATIVNNRSIAATAVPYRTPYSATKGAGLSLTRASTADLLRSGSRVDWVNPQHR
jgi:short-subunit dehydrogenase